MPMKAKGRPGEGRPGGPLCSDGRSILAHHGPPLGLGPVEILNGQAGKDGDTDNEADRAGEGERHDRVEQICGHGFKPPR